MGKDKTYLFVSINKFGRFKNPFAMITCLSELGLGQRLFILVIQSKMISTSYASNISSWESCWWMKLDLILRTRDVNINYNLDPFTKCNSSSRRARYSPMKCLLDKQEDHPNMHDINKKLCNEMDQPQSFEFEGRSSGRGGGEEGRGGSRGGIKICHVCLTL